MKRGHRESITQTYFGLRLAMAILAVMLYLSTLIQLAFLGCMQSSISAYYYTPARPIFVATLCAIGACLIIYRGNTPTENSLLNVAGFMAFVVAFVPATFDPDDRGCHATNVPSPAEISSAVGNSIGSLFLAGIIALLASRRFLKQHYVSESRFEAPTKRSLYASLVCLTGGVILFLADRADFAKFAHYAAALLFFSFILATVAVNMHHANDPYGRSYRFLFWTTIFLAVLIAALRWPILGAEFRTWLFWVETVGIVGFATFWMIQTKELGGFVDRTHLAEVGVKTTP